MCRDLRCPAGFIKTSLNQDRRIDLNNIPDFIPYFRKENHIRHIAIEGHCYFVNCDMVFTLAISSALILKPKFFSTITTIST